MRSVLFRVSATLITITALLAVPVRLLSQAPGASPARIASATLPDAPRPAIAVAAADPSEGTLPEKTLDASVSSNESASGNESASAASSSSGPQTSTQETGKTQHEQAEEQLKAQEKQRVMGVMATFNTTSNSDALPLSPGQKFKLFFKSSTDPWPFLLAGAVSGIGQADDSNPTWGQGAQGYAKRYGASFSDAFIGNFFGNAVLPVVLREDPRYFQRGKGRVAGRVLWAASSTFWCRRDNGSWGPNYANVGGNLIGAAIARAYYPASERSFGDTISDGLTVSVEGIVGAEVIEFWPDLVRRHNRKMAEKRAHTEGADGEQTGKPQN